MRTYFFIFGILALLCCAVPGFADSINATTPSSCDGVAGNLVANCGFETNSFFSWTLTNTYYDPSPVLGSSPDPNTAVESFNFNGMNPNSGNEFAALGDDVATPTTLAQTFSDTVGSTLTFSFYVSTDDSGGSLLADYDGSTLLSLANNASSQGYAEYSYTVTATGSDTISFIQQGPIGGYIGLDDVVVVDPPPSSTPEPSSLAFAAAALCAVILARRRCSKKTI
jgi:hypothetical protein